MSGYYAVFGGFGPQNWVNELVPDINGKADGLTVMDVNPETGHMKKVCENHDIFSPSMLVVSKDRKHIYSSNEGHDFKFRGSGGGVTSYTFDIETGTVQKLNDSLAFGSSTAYVSLDKTGRYLFAANHGTKFYNTRYEKIPGGYRPVVQRDEGVVSVFRINSDGSIRECVDRFVLNGTGADEFEHASAHPHCVVIDDQDYVIIPNKGGDSIWVAKFDRDAEKLRLLSIFNRGFGSSPRHAIFVPGTDFILVQNEYNAYLGSYHLDRVKGELSEISYIDVEDPSVSVNDSKFGVVSDHSWGCDVQMTPDRRYVYSNCGQPCITQFSFDVNTGKLSLVRYYHDIQGWMRGMRITPDGKYLYVTGVTSEKAYVYRIDNETGELHMEEEIQVPTPTSVVFIEK